MIHYIKGILTLVMEESIVIENHGLGLEILAPQSVMERLPAVGEELKLYTYFYVREDAMRLFGFWSQDDLLVFRLLLTVSGIGPKGALGILSALTADELRFAVFSDDRKAIAKAPGIGAKTAGKLILELKDKLSLEDTLGEKDESANVQRGGPAAQSIASDAVQALAALGIAPVDAWKAVRRVEITEAMDVEDVLKLSLKALS